MSKIDRVLGMLIDHIAIDDENRRHAIYFAGIPLAPTLHSCTRVIGGMLMVVMEYIPDSEGGSLPDSSLPGPVLQAARRDVSKALK